MLNQVSHFQFFGKAYLFVGALVLFLIYRFYRTQVEYLGNEKEQLVQNDVSDASDQQLDFILESLSWWIEDALEQRNNLKIEQYFRQLKNMAAIKRAYLVDTNGIILFSTQQKRLKQQFKEYHNRLLLDIQEVNYSPQDNGIYCLVAPLLGKEYKRVGTLFIEAKFAVSELSASSILKKNKLEYYTSANENTLNLSPKL